VSYGDIHMIIVPRSSGKIIEGKLHLESFPATGEKQDILDIVKSAFNRTQGPKGMPPFDYTLQVVYPWAGEITICIQVVQGSSASISHEHQGFWECFVLGEADTIGLNPLYSMSQARNHIQTSAYRSSFPDAVSSMTSQLRAEAYEP
jgi:hypothetical protein